MTHVDDVLRETPLFEALSEEDASALRAGIIDVRLDRGEILFSEGDPGDKLYIILSGKIKLTKAAPDGRENLLSVHGPGEMFGELSLFDPIPRTSSATAVTSADLAGLAHDDLRSGCRRGPGWRCTCCRPSLSGYGGSTRSRLTWYSRTYPDG